ncbi:hypothetical protein HUJ05_010602 [Dendroctonus ponderosae]|nr:hypothetical protein HUJ05_010602 [Dendroctonus ponderosae]
MVSILYLSSSSFGPMPESITDRITSFRAVALYLVPFFQNSMPVATLSEIRILVASDSKLTTRFVRFNMGRIATARKEVILSAGVFNSPQLLMLSGIGPKEELDKYNIDTIVDLPVGKNLMDHVYYEGLFYSTREDIVMSSSNSTSNYTFYNNTMLENLVLWDNKKRPLTIAASFQAITFYNVNGNTSEAADIEVLLSGPPSNGPTHGEMYTNASYTAVFDVLNTYTDIDITGSSAPASSSNTVKFSTSVSRLTKTPPAEPEPTSIKSYVP